MFWLGMSWGILLTKVLDEYKFISFMTIWTTIFFIPLLVKIGSNITVADDKKLLNREGEVLNDRCPNMFWVVVTTFIFIVFIRSILDRYAQNLNDTLSLSIVFLSFFFVPTLHFIYKNCPIAILFHKNAWNGQVTGLQGEE